MSSRVAPKSHTSATFRNQISRPLSEVQLSVESVSATLLPLCAQQLPLTSHGLGIVRAL